MTRIAVTGLPFFGPRAARGLRAAGFAATYVARPSPRPGSWPGFLRALARCRVFYSIGSSAARGSPNDRLAALRKRIIMHWVGSDVVQAQLDAAEGRLSSRLRAAAVHWADAPWLVEELHEIGIPAVEHPLPIPIAMGAPEPLPPDFKVMIYLPRGDHPAHDIAGTLRVVRALPRTPFLLVGGREVGNPPPNLEQRGFVDDVRSAYRECTAILRLTHHDGLSHTVVEALSLGRHVVWTHSLPGVIQVGGAEDAIAALQGLAAAASRGELALNEEGAAAVTARYGATTIAEELTEAMRSALSGRGPHCP